jgi:hypothetical protein
MDILAAQGTSPEHIRLFIDPLLAELRRLRAIVNDLLQRPEHNGRSTPLTLRRTSRVTQKGAQE